MGLCKCGRKKVTNLFCFEHRVNVCEFCLISSHPKCAVKTYLHWLKDSDYSSQCLLCSKELDNGSECIRLMCLDIFHWQCLDNYASQLPPITTPAGYECPACSMSIIPPANHGGPVAEVLRRKLSSAGWAKSSNFVSPSKKITNFPPTRPDHTLSVFDDSKLLDASVDNYANQFLRDQYLVTPPTTPLKPTETVVPIESTQNDAPVTSRLDRKEKSFDPSKPCIASPSSPREILVDDEETNKYRKRPVKSVEQSSIILCLTRHLSSLVPRSLPQRRFLLLFGLIALVCFATLATLSFIVAPPALEDFPLPMQPRRSAG